MSFLIYERYIKIIDSNLYWRWKKSSSAESKFNESFSMDIFIKKYFNKVKYNAHNV